MLRERLNIISWFRSILLSEGSLQTSPMSWYLWEIVEGKSHSTCLSCSGLAHRMELDLLGVDDLPAPSASIDGDDFLARCRHSEETCA